ncbi:MAG TPA: NAD(P)-dependent oxidoreductase [Opitutaceae bacterium]
MKSIGVLGLGLIGRVWAQHYHAAGVLAGAWNRTPQPDCPRWREAPEAVAQAAEVVQIVVADPDAVGALLEHIAPTLDGSKIVVQSSTIDPASSERFRAAVAARGARYVEAPFTGSKPAAERKEVAYFLGGDAAAIAEIEPLLALVSVRRLALPDHRRAAALKLALNLNTAGLMQALAEALSFARRCGVTDDEFFCALPLNTAWSRLAQLKEPKLREGDFSPQFSVKHMLKDLRLIAGTPGGDDLPLTATVRAQLTAAAETGHADEDFSALIRLLG